MRVNHRCVNDDAKGNHNSRNPADAGDKTQDCLNQPHYQTQREAYSSIHRPGRYVWTGILTDQVEHLTEFETGGKGSFTRVENHDSRIDE